MKRSATAQQKHNTVSDKEARSQAGKLGAAMANMKRVRCENFGFVDLTLSQTAGILSLFRSLPAKRGRVS